jgi:hypothetical protein
VEYAHDLVFQNPARMDALFDELARLSRSERDARGRPYRGFNPFLAEDQQVLPVIFSGEHALVGLTARRLHRVLTTWSRGRVSRLLKRLRLHGLLRKIGHTYTYHITSLGRRLVSAVLHLKNNFMVPRLSAASAPTAAD